MSATTWALATAIVLVKVGCASRWGILADEAYHWTWSQAPAFGYYDQPPLVAWVLWVARGLADTPLVLRVPSMLAWFAAVVALTPVARARGVWWGWAGVVPPLAVLTTLAVPDAWLLAAWGLALAGALRGGRGWVWAGLFGGLAANAKYTGALLVPLLIVAASARERREPWPWLGLALSVVLLVPNLVWNGTHDFVTVRFVLSDGLATVPAPGLQGVATQVLDQIGVVTPVAWAVGVWAAIRAARSADRVDRLLAASCLPVWLLFALAAFGGRPEAHWPAPAWIGAGLLVSRGPFGRWPQIGLVTAGVMLALAVVHVERPLLSLRLDPAVRFGESAALASAVGPGLPVWTERYQEASMLWYQLGTPVATFPGCGRLSQFDLADRSVPAQLRFVRPSTAGAPTCVLARCTRVRPVGSLRPKDPFGRAIAAWDVYEAEGCR